jgi:HlyD family secretion protein
MKQLTRAFWILIASTAAVAIFWSAAADKPVTVHTVVVELRDPLSSIHTNGRVEAERPYEFRAPIAGVCFSRAAREGSAVRAGQLILTLDDLALQSDLAAARAEYAAAEVDHSNTERGPAREELNQAEAELARQGAEVEAASKTLATNEWLLGRKAVSSQEVEESRRALARAQAALAAATTRRDDIRRRYGAVDTRRAQSRVEAARKRVQYLEANIARSVVRAPIDGTLYQFDVRDGAYLNPGDMVGIVADLSRLRVRAYVDEPELGRVKRGSEVLVRWDARPQASWKGTVEHIPSQVVIRGTRSVAEVLCAVSNAADLIPNVNVDVEIVTPRGEVAPSLPRSAVFQDGNDQFVWLVRGGQAFKRKVDTGRSSPSVIEVTRGVSVGDQVVLQSQAPITEGVKVRAEEK